MVSSCFKTLFIVKKQLCGPKFEDVSKVTRAMIREADN